MLSYIPRITFGILKNLFIHSYLTDWHQQDFFALPLLDSDDFMMLASSKYVELTAVAGWTQAYISRFLKNGLQQKWYVVNSRTLLETYRPVRVLEKFIVKTKLVAFDDFSVIRLSEFYQNKKLCAQTYMQHVVVDKNLKKNSLADLAYANGA